MQNSPLAFFESWLDGFLNFERLPRKDMFWLDAMRLLCDRLGNPEKAARCIHVAGSKGKGSVSCMAAAILSAAGFRCGLYTSPHVSDFRERVTLGGAFFPDEIYIDSAHELMAAVESIDGWPDGRAPTWFELVTAFAFLCFRRARVEWCVVEVGMGGRLDATNVVSPALSCITPIELEHVKYLGDTLEKIAAEKAGIIKSNVPVLVAKQQSDSVREIFKKKAAADNAPCTFVDNFTTFRGYSYTFVDKLRTFRGGQYTFIDILRTFRGNQSACAHDADKSRDYTNGGDAPCHMAVDFESPLFSRPVRANLRLCGKIQAENAMQAAIAVKNVLPALDEAAVETGLSNAFLPGRFEIALPQKHAPLVLALDGAHTVRSIENALLTLDELFPKTETPRHLLFACAADKDVEDIASLFCGRFSRVTLTRPGAEKKSDLARAEAAFKNAGVAFKTERDFTKAISASFEAAQKENAVLLATGSFYLLAEVKKALE